MAGPYTAVTGARAKLFVGETEIGWATGVSAQANIQQQPVEILGEIDPVEIEAVGRSISISADFVRIKSNSLVTLGIWPRGGSDATQTIVDFPALTAEVHDGITDEAIYKIEGLKCQTRSFRVDRGGLMTVNASFIGLRIYDEVDA